MGFEDQGHQSDPRAQQNVSPPKTPLPNDKVNNASQSQPAMPQAANKVEYYQEPAYQEHVSQPLKYEPVNPAAAPYRPDSNHEQPVYTQPSVYPHAPAPAPQPQQGPYASYPYQQQPAQYPYHPQAGYPPQPQYGWGHPYQGQPNGYIPYGGYYPTPGPYQHVLPYGGYPFYGYGYGYGYGVPLKPKRDTYQFVISIIATVCSGIVLATGIICAFTLLMVLILQPIMARQAGASGQGTVFSQITMFTALTLAGLGGGSFALYHSIRALMRKTSLVFKVPSISIKLPSLQRIKIPWFVVFLVLYIVMVGVGLAVRGNTTVAANTPLTVLLIALAGLLPALTVMTLGVWRVHDPKQKQWPTTWRRFAVALTSGATAAILFAMIFELILDAVVTAGLHVNSFQLDDPNAPIPTEARTVLYFFLVAAVIAPIVEETVKPLAVVTLIGRINSAAEAFILGMACGIGFDLIETSGYIGMGYSNWVDIAIQRSSAGLLHSFGAGMTALGWYLLTHRQSLPKNRILIAVGCGLYAMCQHAIWNGSFVFQLLPAPVGSYLDNGVITIGNYPVPAVLLVYLVETILMLLFFLFVTGKLSGRKRQPGTPWFGKYQPASTAKLDQSPNQTTDRSYDPQPQPLR